YPDRDLAIAKSIDETTELPVYPLADEGGRIGWSFEVLANHRAQRHTEMEFAVPIDRSLECLDEVRSMIAGRFPDLSWPVEYRTLAGDDVWLSQAFDGDAATISIHQAADVSDVALFGACETIFRRYAGRPHWGKVHFFDGDDLAAVHPGWTAWWEVRDAIDPTGVFLNDTLRAWRP
ncbi:MAG: D-arabinono-1,4-lactone oxidase, partial [Ilumatobacteraceae bacterium]